MIKSKVLTIVILSILINASCGNRRVNIPITPTPITESFIENTPITSHPAITHPTATQEANTLFVENSIIQPGVYLVYRNRDDIYATNEWGSFLVLSQAPEDTFISASPDGLHFVYMKNGAMYAQNIMDHQAKTIPYPSHSLDTNWWDGAWSYDKHYLIYAIDKVYDETQSPEFQEFPSIYITDFFKNTYSQVTLGATVETSPSWSPDNQTISFASDNQKIKNGAHFAGATDIFVMSAKCVSNIETCRSSFAKQLTFSGTAGDAINPAWNPTGANIGYIYLDGQTGDKDIYLVDLNGKVSNLTNTPAQYEDAFSWSPDGKNIVFRRYSPGDGTDLFVYNIISSSSIKITNTPNTTEGTPAWSPDGKRVAFQQNTDDPNSGIMLYSLDASSSQLLENSSGSKFLFWVTFFPDILPGTILTISPSGHGLNIRSNASVDSQVIGKLNSGDKVEILSEPVVGDIYSWWMIKSETTEGWVAQLYNWYLP